MVTGELHSEIITLLRIQRHDFVNHLQVIHTMIQLGKSDLALNYIMELSRNPDAMTTEELKSRLEALTTFLSNGKIAGQSLIRNMSEGTY